MEKKCQCVGKEMGCFSSFLLPPLSPSPYPPPSPSLPNSCSPARPLSPLCSSPLPCILNDFQVCPLGQPFGPILGRLGLCLHKHKTKVREWGTPEVQHQRKKKKNFEVLRMKLVKIILDGDRPIYVPRKRNVLRKLFPWTLWVLVNTFQPCD